MKLKEFVIFNPVEHLPKNKLFRKISMKQISPFTRRVESNIFKLYNEGSKFCNGDTIFAKITPCLENGKTSYVSGLRKNEIAFGSTEYIVVRAKKGVSLPLFIYYLMITNHIRDIAIASMVGSSGRERVQQNVLDNIEIPKYSFKFQQHIVDTIGSVDDLIENLARQNDFLFEFGLNKINDFNKKSKLDLLKNIAEFHKGVEIGSSKYKETHNSNLIQYIRVSDLTTKGNTYVQFEKQLKTANFDDILLALDGAPGRNNIGYSGAYSSGIYKAQADTINRGLTYFEINSTINKEIISNHSQGTTILHASKSINYLVYAVITNDDKEILNNLFDRILFNKRKIEYLSSIKRVLLNKYFR